MPRTRVDPRRIKIHYSHSVEEVGRQLGVHKNTVRGWIKNGLPVIDTSRPTLIQGRDLRAFLEARRQSKKSHCPPGTIYCLKCRAPRRPAGEMVDLLPFTAVSGNLCALCDTCGTMMHRRTRIDAIGAVMPGIDVQFTEAESRLGDRPRPSLFCDSKA